MAFNLGAFLHSVMGSVGNAVQGAEHAVGSAIQGGEHAVQQGANNLVQNVTHPQAFAQNTAHPVVQLLNSLYSSVHHPAPITNTNPHAVMPLPGQYFTDGTPNLNDPKQNPTSVGRVWGNAVANNTAHEQGFSDFFKKIIDDAKTYVGNDSSALGNHLAGADYNPGTNQIELKAGQLDPYTVTHEALHAAFQRKTPAAQTAFATKVASKATPVQQRVLNSDMQLGNPIYQGQHPLTEVHSFLPQMNAPSPTQGYYSRYFSNPNFWRGPNTAHDIADRTGFNMLKPGTRTPTLTFAQAYGGDN